MKASSFNTCLLAAAILGAMLMVFGLGMMAAGLLGRLAHFVYFLIVVAGGVLGLGGFMAYAAMTGQEN